MAKRNYRKHREQLAKKRHYDRAKAEDVRLKAMEKLSETKKRGSSANESDDKPKRQRRMEVMLSKKTQTKHFLDFLK